MTQEATAYHEAGHAVAAVALGIGFHHVTVAAREDDGSLGHINYGVVTAFMNAGRRSASRELREYLVCNRAGQIAESIHTGQHNADGASGDDEVFWETLWAMYGERRDRHARELTREARRLVLHHWGAVGRVAAALLDGQTLTYEAVEQLVNG